MSKHSSKRPSLVVVGTGIKLIAQVTPEAHAAITRADKVLYLVADPATARWIERLNPTAESIYRFYRPGKRRLPAYERMVERILECLREGQKVCAAFYGHPGVFAYPPHEAIRRARQEGFEARMLPGVSSEDCLFADLGVDPSRSGCQSFEATDFLIRRRKFDTTSSLILWQIGTVGNLTLQTELCDRKNLCVLTDYLEGFYGQEHEVQIYEAATLPVLRPAVDRLPLHSLRDAPVMPISTLYVPPKGCAELDGGMMQRLGLKR